MGYPSSGSEIVAQGHRIIPVSAWSARLPASSIQATRRDLRALCDRAPCVSAARASDAARQVRPCRNSVRHPRCDFPMTVSNWYPHPWRQSNEQMTPARPRPHPSPSRRAFWLPSKDARSRSDPGRGRRCQALPWLMSRAAAVLSVARYFVRSLCSGPRFGSRLRVRGPLFLLVGIAGITVSRSMSNQYPRGARQISASARHHTLRDTADAPRLIKD
jgi:hypothetical protein